MNRYKRPLIYLALVIILALTVYYATGCSENNDSEPTSTADQEVGTDMTDFTTVTLDGKEVDQSIFADYELTMVNFWATYCGPCIQEMPDLGRIHRERQADGFNIVGIVLDVQDSSFAVNDSMVQTADSIIETTGADYTQLLLSEDIVDKMIEAYSIQSIPTTLFVDSKGKVIGSPYIGGKSKADWEKIIDSINVN